MPINLESLTDYVLLITAFFGAFLSALWLSLVIWTFRDMRSRSRDIFAQVLAALVVALLTLPGLIIYLILRPPRTLAESYEQSLEEEALLQEIEDKRVCPGCGRHAQEEWVACPHCFTRLKKNCAHCGRLMDLPWNLCPYCTQPVEGMRLPELEPAADADLLAQLEAGENYPPPDEIEPYPGTEPPPEWQPDSDAPPPAPHPRDD